MKLSALLPVLLALGLASCAEWMPGGGDAADAAAAEALAAAKAPAGDQKAALARAQRRFEQEGSPENRLKLATLLVVAAPPLRDEARAAELLAPIADPGSPGAGRFAALLLQQLSERQRLVRQIDRLTKERERADRERAASDKERAASDKERDAREEALRQQLEALRGIERGIIEREDRLRRRPR